MRIKSRKLAKTHPCKMRCGRSVAINGRVCIPCRSWWYYHSAQTAEQFATYLNRHHQAAERIARFSYPRRRKVS